MDHQERMDLARKLCAQAAREVGDVFRFAGAVGSVFRGDDVELSDLDLVIVRADNSRFWDFHLLYRGCSVNATVYSEDGLRGLLGPSLKWSETMGVLDGVVVLEGDADGPKTWLDHGLSRPQQAFGALLRREMPSLVYESYNRLLCCRLRGQYSSARVSAIEMLLEMHTVLCLLNRRWTHRGYLDGIVEAAAFPKLPHGWAELAPALWNESDPDQTVMLGQKVFKAYAQLLRDEGLEPVDYQCVEQIVLH